MISEVGKPPEFVLEIASETTASRDETIKREGYAEMGVPEYWRFDGSGKGLYSRPLSGDRLVGDAYEPIEITEEAAGEVRGYSRALSLYLCSDDENRLRFWDPATQKYLPTHLEAMEAMDERDQERAARIEAEAEIARLRDRLRRS